MRDRGDYRVAGQWTRLPAHGNLPSAPGRDAAKPPSDRMLASFWVAERNVQTEGGGCAAYNSTNPAKGGLVEHKVPCATTASGALWAASGAYVVRE
jgi:hypothetical protein